MRKDKEKQNVKQGLKSLLETLALIGIGVFLGAVGKGCYEFGAMSITLASISPNGEYRVRVYDRGFSFDRNFFVYVGERESGEKKLIHRSPDEGPKGSEMIIWSRSGRQFALVGKRFSRGLTVNRQGYQVYLIHDNVQDLTWIHPKVDILKKYKWEWKMGVEAREIQEGR